MNHKFNHSKWIVRARMVAICTILCALSGVCASAGADEIAKPNVKFNNKHVEVTHVVYNPWGLQMVKAISEGDIRAVDRLLDDEKVCINDVISTRDCTTELPWTLWDPNSSVDAKCRPYHFTDIVSRMRNFQTEAAMNDIRYTSHSYHVARRLPAINYDYEIFGTPLMIAVRLRNSYMVNELLRRGANPNVFIRCAAVCFSRIGEWSDFSVITSGQMPTTDGSLDGYLLPRLCALTDLYGTGTLQTQRTDDAIAEVLVKAGAVFPNKEDGRGRTAMWDVAAVRSIYLLKLLCSNGWDVNHKDHLGNTVADYCVKKLATQPQGEGREMLVRFIRELGRLGANVPFTTPGTKSMENVRPLRLSTSNRDGSTSDMTPDQPQLQSTNHLLAKEDHSMERAQIQARIDALRIELIEAERNHHNAIVQGTGAIIAGMRVSAIRQEISDLTMEQKRLMDY